MVHSEAVSGEQDAAGGLEAVFASVFRELKPRTTLEQVVVEFRRSAAGRSTIRFQGAALLVRLCDVFRSAPAEVWVAVAHVLIAKLFRLPVLPRHESRYRGFVNRKDVVAVLERTRRERGRKRVNPPAGKRYDLVQIFEKLNVVYFHGLMARPDLGWSQQAARWLLGHYDAAHHMIVLNCILDSEVVPEHVVEYVMYHEMLHLLYPVERRRGRRCIHSKEFREREREFREAGQAEKWLREELPSLSRGRDPKRIRRR